MKELIDALSLARRSLEQESASADLELRLRSRDLRRGMERELSLPGLRALLDP